ncbi:hypothetical protein V1503_24290 [Bacillus sp. SCS-151]|uniref:hypothetical protein n=1 Tax=Nanhaiella sioensis TaxID=3115293 RepID=UPI00397A913E
MDKEYVVYSSRMVPSKIKGDFPEVIKTNLSDSLFNPGYTNDINSSYRFYELGEAEEAADFLGMEVEELELRLKPIG